MTSDCQHAMTCDGPLSAVARHRRRRPTTWPTRYLMWEAIRGHQRQSEAIRGNQGRGRPTRYLAGACSARASATRAIVSRPWMHARERTARRIGCRCGDLHLAAAIAAVLHAVPDEDHQRWNGCEGADRCHGASAACSWAPRRILGRDGQPDAASRQAAAARPKVLRRGIPARPRRQPCTLIGRG